MEFKSTFESWQQSASVGLWASEPVIQSSRSFKHGTRQDVTLFHYWQQDLNTLHIALTGLGDGGSEPLGCANRIREMHWTPEPVPGL